MSRDLHFASIFLNTKMVTITDTRREQHVGLESSVEQHSPCLMLLKFEQLPTLMTFAPFVRQYGYTSLETNHIMSCFPTAAYFVVFKLK